MRWRYMSALIFLVAVGGVLGAEGLREEGESSSRYEVWALDQGTNRIHIIARENEGPEPAFEVTDVIDLAAHSSAIDMPHMIDFTSDHRFAFIASPASGNTTVIRAEDREIVAVFDTGPGSHMAGVTPDDSRVLVDVMGTGRIEEILIDLDRGEFSRGRSLLITEDPLFRRNAHLFPTDADGRPVARPICHACTADSRYAYITLGPGLTDAGLVILDIERFELVQVYPGSELAVNCGTVLGPDGERMFVNGGSPETGHWYVFDTATHRPIPDETGEIRRSSRGTDAHGVWITPDGEELWMVNRHSSDGIIIDPRTGRVMEEIDWTGKSPDILTFSPDGRYAYITLRGPEPRSGTHAIAGDTPGVAIFEVSSRSLVTILRPEQVPESDFHGIGIRSLTPEGDVTAAR